jgi:hypothetical protein
LDRLGGAGAVNVSNEAVVTVVLAPRESLARRVARHGGGVSF